MVYESTDGHKPRLHARRCHGFMQEDLGARQVPWNISHTTKLHDRALLFSPHDSIAAKAIKPLDPHAVASRFELSADPPPL